VNLVYYWSVRALSSEDRDKFDAALSAPITGSSGQRVRQAVGAWSRESELAQFKKG
jgi:hypothetical protein